MQLPFAVRPPRDRSMRVAAGISHVKKWNVGFIYAHKGIFGLKQRVGGGILCGDRRAS
jgi:hypothetical protein